MRVVSSLIYQELVKLIKIIRKIIIFIMDKNKLTITDLILDSERIKIDEYLPFLKCSNCFEYMLDPKYCMQCGRHICDTCLKKTCNHPANISRHFKLILDNLTFSCKYSKYGCMEKIKFLDLKSHNQRCEYARSDSIQFLKLEKKKSSIYSLNDYVVRNDDESYKANSFYNLKCLKCNQIFPDKEHFVYHLSSCYEKKDDENSNESKERLLKEFRENVNKYLDGNFNYWKQTNLEWIENLKLVNLDFENSYEKNRGKINDLVLSISNYLANGYINSDLEYVQLLELEKNLTEKKNELMKRQEEKVRELNEKQSFLENNIQNKIEQYKKSLNEIETQKLIICEELKKKGNFQIISDLSESSLSNCSHCGNSDDKIKKLFCNNCRKKFCENKCVNICKGNICNQNGIIVCPNCSSSCGLCRKYNYCDNCKRKCFYNLCNNRFCPECYKKNEHQARNPNINCKFFTCEIDNRCDCLMTSLFCNKCEKRMCSNCSIKHTNHFPFLA